MIIKFYKDNGGYPYTLMAINYTLEQMNLKPVYPRYQDKEGNLVLLSDDEIETELKLAQYNKLKEELGLWFLFLFFY